MPLPWAFNSATAMKLDWNREFGCWQRFGWNKVELWYDKVETACKQGRSLDDLDRQLRDAGIQAVGMAPAIVWTTGQKIDPAQQRAQWLPRLDATAALHASALTFVALGDPAGDLEAEYDHLADLLRQAGDLAAQRGLRINLEFLGGLAINGCLGTCIDLVRRTDHPAVGMLFDLCHYYVSASHVEELALLPAGKLFHVHVDDAPCGTFMETLKNDQRCFPGQGRIDVPGLLRRVISATAYQGPLGIEIYDPRVWELDATDIFQRTATSMAYVEQHWA